MSSGGQPNPLLRRPHQHYSLIGYRSYLKLDETDNLFEPRRAATPRHLSVVTRAYLPAPPDFRMNLVSGSTYWGLGLTSEQSWRGRLALAIARWRPLFPTPRPITDLRRGSGSIRPYGSTRWTAR